MSKPAKSPTATGATPTEVWVVSACLIGAPCRYDGTPAKEAARRALAILDDTVEVIPLCPEGLGGLPTPRPAANLVGGDGAAVLDGNASVRTAAGDDVTAAFIDGARQAATIAEQSNATHACLKARSPSCGCGSIHRATMQSPDVSTLDAGDGVAAALLKRKGLVVMTDEDVAAFQQAKRHPSSVD